MTAIKRRLHHGHKPALLGVDYSQQQAFKRQLTQLLGQHCGGVERLLEKMQDEDTRKVVRGNMMHSNGYCYAVPFCFADAGGIEHGQASGHVEVNPSGILVRLDNYTDSCSEDNQGYPILIEQYEGEVIVRVYGDVNDDAPTHSVSLADARNERRKPDFQHAS